MYVCVCMYVWMDGWMDGWTDGRMDGWMDGCMHACMHVCMVPCPVFPRAWAWGDHTIGGGQGSGVRDSYIYIWSSFSQSVFPHFHTHPITPIQWNSLAQPSSKYLDLRLKHFLVKVSFSVLRRNSKLMAFLGFCWVSVGFLLWHSVLHRSKTMQEAAAWWFQ